MSTQSIRHVDGLVQERRNSGVLALELHLSCTKPSMNSKMRTLCTLSRQTHSEKRHLQGFLMISLHGLSYQLFNVNKLLSMISLWGWNSAFLTSINCLECFHYVGGLKPSFNVTVISFSGVFHGTCYWLILTYIWVSIGSGNGLMPDDTKPLPEPVPYKESAQITIQCNEFENFILKLLSHLLGYSELETF